MLKTQYIVFIIASLVTLLFCWYQGYEIITGRPLLVENMVSPNYTNYTANHLDIS